MFCPAVVCCLQREEESVSPGSSSRASRQASVIALHYSPRPASILTIYATKSLGSRSNTTLVHTFSGLRFFSEQASVTTRLGCSGHQVQSSVLPHYICWLVAILGSARPGSIHSRCSHPHCLSRCLQGHFLVPHCNTLHYTRLYHNQSAPHCIRPQTILQTQPEPVQNPHISSHQFPCPSTTL